LPAGVDARQPTRFCAAWTLASIKHLAEAGVASITYYETVGPRGIMASEHGPRLAGFESTVLAPYPVHDVLARLARFVACDLVASASDRPREVQSLAVRLGSTISMLVANLSPEPRHCRIVGDGTRFELEPFEIVRIDEPV